MKKTSLGRKSSIRFGVDRKSGIPVRAQSSDRMSCGVTSADAFFNAASSTSGRSQSIGSNLNKLFLGVSGPSGERPGRSTAQSSSGMSIRSSGATSSIGAPKKRDNRELTDRGWQAMAMGMIEDVIRSHEGGYEILKGPQPLKPLSISTFTQCCSFLFQLIDPSIEINKVNLVSQLMFLSKKLMYRGKVEKSWIIAVNTPHAFPFAIGFLHFLATLVKCKTQTNPLDIMYPRSFEATDDSEEGTINWDFKKLLNYFVQIGEVRGRPDFEHHRDRLQDQVIQDHVEADAYLPMKSAIDSEYRKLSEGKERLQLEVDEKSELVSIVEMEYEKIQKLSSDAQNRLKKAQHAVQETEKNIKELESELAQMKEGIRRREDIIKEIDETIGAQEISRQQLERAQEQIVQLTNEIASQKKYKEGFADLMYKVDLEICKLNEELEDRVRNFNMKVKDFALMDPEVEKAAIPKSSFQKEDFVKSAQIISNFILKYKEHSKTLVAKITEASAQNKELQDKYEQLMKEKQSLENKRTALRDRYEALSREVNKESDDLLKEKERINSELPHDFSDENLALALEKAKEELAETERKLASVNEIAEDVLKHASQCTKDMISKIRSAAREYNVDLDI